MLPVPRWWSCGKMVYFFKIMEDARLRILPSCVLSVSSSLIKTYCLKEIQELYTIYT
jgi:hypothetical protein